MRNVFLDPVLVHLAWDLYEGSPDPAIDMALIVFILANKQFSGQHQGWTWVSAKAYSQKFHVSYTRVKTALDRLVEEGLLETRQTKYQYGRYRHWYKSTLVSEDSEPVLKAREDRTSDVRSLEERRQELQRTPVSVVPKKPESDLAVKPPEELRYPEPVEEVPAVPYFEFEYGPMRMVRRMVTPSNIVLYDKCPSCGRYVHPWGWKDTGDHSMCLGCWAEQVREQGGTHIVFLKDPIPLEKLVWVDDERNVAS